MKFKKGPDYQLRENWLRSREHAHRDPGVMLRELECAVPPGAEGQAQGQDSFSFTPRPATTHRR